MVKTPDGKHHQELVTDWTAPDFSYYAFGRVLAARRKKEFLENKAREELEDANNRETKRTAEKTHRLK